MFVSQIRDRDGRTRVVARDGHEAYLVRGADSVYTLALEAVRAGTTLADRIGACGFDEAVDLARAGEEERMLPPVTHPDPAHLHLTGTGLTHLGSAAARDAMHQAAADAEETISDSMRMFRMGLDGGKPAPGRIGVQPEWFYKGNGFAVAAPGAPLVSPGFAEDGGEEPEIAGVYVVADDGTPARIGFALANEFSDHVLERRNYLYLAHSKLRPCSFGPEILVGPLPADLRGTSRIRRGGRTVWEKPFLSGEANMSHTIANLEHHHFKYALFRQPGDVHVHMFGTATISFADGMRAEPGDVFEIEVAAFGLPLRNPLVGEPAPDGRAVAVRVL
ncbi:AraD1 family protein [Azospirillum halopraeferens]|uniref:AraD1 family protein n=1 Tax=Azospirillum halopraeferens TaxID=34010 RepID=UPI00041D7AC5|nr:AraD1 family protein [Azospirillum halopraeferens]